MITPSRYQSSLLVPLTHTYATIRVEKYIAKMSRLIELTTNLSERFDRIKVTNITWIIRLAPVEAVLHRKRMDQVITRQASRIGPLNKLTHPRKIRGVTFQSSHEPAENVIVKI